MLHIDPQSLAAKQLKKTYLGNRRFKEIEFSAIFEPSALYMRTM
jgi:hypothetical protein